MVYIEFGPREEDAKCVIFKKRVKKLRAHVTINISLLKIKYFLILKI